VKIDVREGVVYLGEGELEDPIELEPAAASVLGARLGQAAHLGWRQQAAIAAACEDGHQWGEPYNGWLGSQHVTVEPCQREGCREYNYTRGWMPFAGRPHLYPPAYGGRRDCTGPGCEWCDTEEFGRHVRQILVSVFADLDRMVLGAPVEAG